MGERKTRWLAVRTARLKRKEERLRLLKESYLERSPWLVMIQNEPEFDFLHSDERYRALVKKIGPSACVLKCYIL